MTKILFMILCSIQNKRFSIYFKRFSFIVLENALKLTVLYAVLKSWMSVSYAGCL